MESTPEEAAKGLVIVQVLAAVLDRLVCTNTSIARADPGQVTKFHALKAPGIGILQYLERIHKYASCSSECFIMALIYIDRLIQRNNFLLTELNVHRVVITAILLAAKFFDDAYYNNAYYAKVGGVLIGEMNGLEVDFLFRINFSLHVTPEVFEKYKAELLSHSVAAPLPIEHSEVMQTSIVPQYANNALIPEHVQSAANIHSQGPDIMQFNTCNEHAPVQSQIAPSQISPSPTRVLSRNNSLPLDISSSASNSMMVSDYGQASIPPSNTHSDLYTHVPLNYLHRANSCPVPRKSTFEQSHHQPHPFSAPAMATMFPVGLHGEMNDPYVVLDNQIFPIQGTLVHHHHGLDVTNLLRHGAVANDYHQPHHGSGYMSRDAAEGQSFVRSHGRILTGVSGGV